MEKQAHIWGKKEPSRSYLEYRDPIMECPIRPKNHQGQPMVQPETYKAHYRGLYGQPRLYQAKRPIQVTIGPFTPYLEYKVTIQVITIEPRIHQGQLSIFRAKQDYMGPILMSSIGLKTYQIQLRCHIVHYRALYCKPMLCERKLTYIP